MKNKNIYLIVGASAAGIAAAKKIRSLEPDAQILCFSAEKEMPYNKCFLVDWLAQEREYEALFLHTKEFFEAQRIELKLDTVVIKIDREKKQIITHDGTQYFYTKLLVATGASARQVPLHTFVNAQGKQQESIKNIVPFYTLADTEKVYSLARQNNVKNIVIIGGGISGIECADALRLLGKNITVIERGAQILIHQLSSEYAADLMQRAQKDNVNCLINTALVDIIETGNAGFEISCISSLHGSEEKITVHADLIITTLGSVPNVELAQECNLVLEHFGIQTNSFLQTSDPDIFGAGDCATVRDSIHKTPIRSIMWSDALVQGMVAGTNMVTLTREYAGALPITVSHLFGMQLASYRRDLIESGLYRVEYKHEQNAQYCIAFDTTNVVVAFICLGFAISYTHIKKSLITGTPYSATN